MPDITTGLQAVSATGAVTGTLSVVTLTGGFSIRGVVQGLPVGYKAMIAIEDTAASTTPFSDALALAVFHVEGTNDPSGVSFEKAWYDVPLALRGAANNAWRTNVYRITSGATFNIHVWADELD